MSILRLSIGETPLSFDENRHPESCQHPNHQIAIIDLLLLDVITHFCLFDENTAQFCLNSLPIVS